MSTGALRRLGRYELVARIGEGGMAEVHLARQRGPRQFEKLVVVKTVRPALASRPEVASLLLEEARIAALVKHPNVVDIYDLGEEKGTFFIAMEYLEGESLSSVLRSSRPTMRLDPFSTARIIADGAAGLHAAHELHSHTGEALELVHQDVTPGNMIVLYSGGVKLVDFGVAKVRTSVDDGLLKGKTGYLAPELLDGAHADRRSDIWSLGVVLWEALTLRRLFHGKTDEEAVAKIRGAQVPAPSSLAPATPRDLDEICFLALQRDPAKRYQTAQAMQADLAQILRHASWSGGSEPIARFMRGLFAERIAARKQLLRELATGKPARATTIEQLNALRDDGSPVTAAAEPRVVGSHGTAEVQIIVDGGADDAPRATTAPTVPQPTKRRRWSVAVAVGVMALAALGVAFAMSNRAGAPGGGPDAGAGTQFAAVTSPPEHPAVVLDAAPAVVEPVPEAVADAAVEVVAPEPPDDDDHHHHHHHHDDDKDKPPTPEPPPTAVPTTAKSLYKEGLRTFVSGDVAGAIALFDRARAKDSHYAPTYRGLGMAYEKRGDKRKAAQNFEKYLDLAPDAADAAGIRARLERLK